MSAALPPPTAPPDAPTATAMLSAALPNAAEAPASHGPIRPAPAGQSAIRNLLESCLRILKLTGGSRYWTGETQAALEFMEAAVAEALEIGALRPPQIGTSPVLPEIIGTAAASVDHTLQMAGIETARRQS